jgi:hypothetical protein
VEAEAASRPPLPRAPRAAPSTTSAFTDDGVMINMASRDMTKQIGLKIGFITDPNGAYIEVTQGLKELNDK